MENYNCVPQNTLQSYTYPRYVKRKTVTTVREFDENERLVRETVTEVTESTPEYSPTWTVNLTN